LTEIVPVLNNAEASKVTASSIEFKLLFTGTNFVSLNLDDPCEIELSIKPNYFRDVLTGNFIDEYKVTTVYLPRLLEDDIGDSYIDVVDDTSSGATTILTLKLLFDIAVGSSLKMMWQMVNTL